MPGIGRPCLAADNLLSSTLPRVEFSCSNGQHCAVAETRFDFYADETRPGGVSHFLTCARHRAANKESKQRKEDERLRVAKEEEDEPRRLRVAKEEEDERLRVAKEEEEEDVALEHELLAIKVLSFPA